MTVRPPVETSEVSRVPHRPSQLLRTTSKNLKDAVPRYLVSQPKVERLPSENNFSYGFILNEIHKKHTLFTKNNITRSTMGTTKRVRVQMEKPILQE